jgi:ribosomal protein S18 acetylase RimI-like enzyme
MRTDSGLRVWLFWNVDELVGFASLGQTEWSYPRPNGSKKVVVQIIPNLAVSVTHGNRGYGREILQGVIVEALRRRDTVSELLGLLVHVENARAIHIYDTEGFENHGKPSTYDGESFQRMIITLPAAHEVVVS